MSDVKYSSQTWKLVTHISKCNYMLSNIKALLVYYVGHCCVVQSRIGTK